MTETEAESLVPLAAELVATIRDYSPDDTARVLARVPDMSALAIVLAAMVDPDARPSELLAWTHSGPVKSRDAIPSHLELRNLPDEAWGRKRDVREEVAVLTRAGLSAAEIAVRTRITTRSVSRHRKALREAAEMRTDVA